MRSENVLALEVEPREPFALLRADELRAGLLAKGHVKAEMTRACFTKLVRFGEAAKCVFAHRLQEPIALAFGVEHDE